MITFRVYSWARILDSIKSLDRRPAEITPQLNGPHIELFDHL